MRKKIHLLCCVLLHATVLLAQPDQSKPVGSIKGEASVSPAGAATYKIPVPVPAGVAGMQPSLALAYSSQAGDGQAGWGWNLEGLSLITRVNQSRFFNGRTEPFKMTADDNFFVDGQLLMPVSGTNGANATQYKTQTENQARIESFGGTTGNPDWWKVTRKDGSTVEYGKKADDKIAAGANISWLVSSITDVNGNKIDYTYSRYDAELALYEIAYSNTIVRFTYTTKANPNITFINGHKIINSRLLSQISILLNNVQQQKITFQYDTQLGRNYLTTAELFGTDNQSVITRFNYGQLSQEENATALQSNYPVQGGSHNWTLTPGDFNGDGKSDLVVANLQYNVQDNEIKDVTSSYYNLITNAGVPSSPYALATSKYELQTSYNANNYLKGNDENHPFVYMNSDLDGDGIDDMLRIGKNLNNFQDSRGDWHNNGMYYVDNLSVDKFTPSGTAVSRTTTTLPVPNDYMGTYNFTLKDANSSIQGDFDGDGSVDIIHVLGRQYQSGETIERRFNIFNGWYIYRRTPIYDYVYKSFVVNMTAGESNAEILGLTDQLKDAKAIYPIDYDGDGKQELLVIKDTYSTIFSIYRVSATTGYLYAASQLLQTMQLTYSTSRMYQLGDFNGDKKTDILSIYNGSSTATIYYSTGTGFLTGNVPLQRTTNFTSAWPDRVIAADYNGDGITDILHAYEYPVVIPIPGGTQTSYSPRQEVYYMKGLTYSTSYIYSTTELCPSDYAWFVNSWPDAQIAGYSNDIYCYGVNPELPQPMRLPVDPGESSPAYIVHYNYQEVENLYPKYTYKTSWLSGMASNFRMPMETGDFDGDGKTEIIQSLNGTGYIVCYFSGIAGNGNTSRLQTVTDGFGNVTTFNYNTLANGGTTVYTRTPGNTMWYPYNTVSLPITVVKSLTKPNGIGGVQTDSYLYQDAIVHRSKGFLGFKGVTVSNTTTDSKSETTSELNQNVALMLPATDKTWINNLQVQEVQNKYTVTTLANGSTRYYPLSRYKTEQEYSTTIDMQSLAARKTAWVYDAHGNITSQTQTKGAWSGGSVSAIETIATSTTYTQAGPALTPLQPVTVQETRTRSGAAAITQQTTMSYTADRGLLASKTTWASTPLAATVTYSYDSYGNCTGTTSAVAGKATVTSTITFDASHRFPEQHVMQTGSIISTKKATYHAYWGKPITEVEGDAASGTLTTAYEYNGFGVLSKTTTPLGHQITHSTGWDVAGAQLYYALTDFPDGVAPDVKVWYDVYGRAIKSQSLGWSNQWATTTTKYDARGRVTEKALPYYSSETPQLTTTSYDHLNRQLTVTTPNSAASYTYYQAGNGQTTVTVTNAAGQASSRTTDATGLLVNATDNGGTLSYTYNSVGKEQSVQLNGQAVSSSGFDAYGRETSKTEPNTGTITYEYDALSHLTRQTDANGDITHISYDDLERVSVRTTKEGAYSYTYNNSDLNKEIQSIAGPAGTETYTYDGYRRLTGKTQTVPGSGTFTTTYQYNPAGKQLSVTYPNNVTIQSAYNTAGMVTQLTWGSKVLYNAQAVNGTGQPVQYTLADGRTSTITYNKSLPARYYTPGVQDLNFTFNTQNGNLTSRRDDIAGITETFTYDAVDRLTSATVNGTQQFSVTYDGTNNSTKGNIQEKSDVGTYVYQSAKPNAIAYISPLSPAVNAAAAGLTATYTSFQRPLHLEQNGAIADFTYGVDNERTRMVLNAGTQTQTRLYLGAYEKQTLANGTVNEVVYVGGGNGLCAMIVNGHAYTVYTDYLGSILTVTSENGTIAAQQNFDAWGRNRNAQTWQYANVAAVPNWLMRGYTGHEHIPVIDLINMNARLYDPMTGRMLSPDPYVMGNGNTQGFNRFAYALNNPLRYTDPNGEIVWFVPLIYAAVNVAVDLVMNKGNMNFGQIAMSAVSGAIGGFLGGGSITTVGGAFFGAGVGQLNKLFPAMPLYQSEHFNLNVSPMIGFGSSGVTSGISLNASGVIGDFAYSASVGMGFNSGVSSLGESVGSSNYWNWGASAGYFDGHTTYGAGWSVNYFTGTSKQNVAAPTLLIGDFTLRVDEDFLGDGEDRYRTGGLLATYKVNDEITLALGGSMMTGQAQESEKHPNLDFGHPTLGTYNPAGELNTTLRGGTMYGGVIYKGQAFFYGHNSETRLHNIQNWIHRNVVQTAYFYDHQLPSQSYFYSGGFNSNYLFY